MMPPMSPAIVANDHFVYVLRGNTLCQYHMQTLKLINKAELEEPKRPVSKEGSSEKPDNH
ncbi:MAG: hypothetical protein SGI71_07940 [Verrucomicrobiota bacterium]|nr:hypothetical protein [Verrucomicrobiota bacterium]